MDLIVKQAISILTNRQNITINELLEMLHSNNNLPSFEQQTLLDRLSQMDGINRVNDSLSYNKKNNRLQLYIEDKSEDKKYLKVIDEIYQIILKEEDGLQYEQIRKQLSKKLELNQISHYCRKLFDLNLVLITCRSHCKQVKARKYFDKVQWTGFQDEQTQKTLEQQPNYYRELNFYSNLWLNLQEPLLESDVRQRMDKCEESKSFSRLIDNLFKVDGVLDQVAERRGKIFMYRYKANQPIKKWPYLTQNQTPTIKGILVIKFQKEVMKDLQRLLSQQGREVELDNYKIGECLNNILLGESEGKRKIQISQQKINRFACICNYLHNFQIANVKEIRDQISESEKDENNGVIDTRTIHSLLKILESVKFLRIHIVKTTIVQKICERWLVSHFTVSNEDPILKEGLRKLSDICLEKAYFKPKQALNEVMTTRSKKMVKVDQHIDIKSEQESNQEKVFQSDEDDVKYKKVQSKYFKINKAFTKFEETINNKNTKLINQAFQMLRPNYDVQIANEIFQKVSNLESSIGLLLGLEQKIMKNLDVKKEFNSNSFDEWETETKQLNPLKALQFKPLQQELSDQEYQHNKQFKKNHSNYESQKLGAEKLKNYLLRYPNQTISKLTHIFPNVNVYALLKKMIQDKTIEINILTNKSYDLDEALNLYSADQIRYKINENYLGYF